MRKYRLVAKKGEGTFSEVLKAQNVKDNKFHAIKCMKNHFESIDQVNNLREIQALRRLSPHQHIVKLEEVLYDQPSGRLALVFELMDANLYEMIRGRRHYLKPDLVQSLMYQLVKSLDHMHNKGIFHRDIKPENILVEDSTKLKLADFGSCRGIYSKQPYTEYISTRWYRAPECLLTDGYYGPEMDMWGVGCVFFEITSLYPLFPGSNELDQIHRIHKILGTPSSEVLEIFKRKGAAHIDFNFPKEEGTNIAKLIPHASPAAIDLMNRMLAYDPSKRMNAREALRHEYFREIRDLEEASLRSHQQQQAQHVIQPQQHPSVGLSIASKQRKGNDNSDDKTPLPSIQNGSHGLQTTTDTKDYGGHDASEDELPPINHAAGGRGMGGITHVKTRKYSFSSKSVNNKTSESSLGGGSMYSGGISKASKGGHSNGGSTNRSTYHQDVKIRKNVANVSLKKGFSSARNKKIVGASAAYADASAVYADASGRGYHGVLHQR
ncbi:CMGC/RCK protein kinase [Phytophthora nicotianae]|uniref:CMGC/RCK protein kinase n=1 Tax=Phytophthora nicotianae TaxID=4792 RepID=W2KE21_PHYNI|nr:CMGC/RCK protein kinase [Phytophthora nicotianae]